MASFGLGFEEARRVLTLASQNAGPQGHAAQRRGHRRVRGQPRARAASRADQRHRHRLPPHQGEFDAVGIEREPSLRVGPPRVAASPVALECRLHATLGIGRSTLVLGEVLHAAVREDVIVDGHPDIRRLRPLARLGRDEWGTVGEVHDRARIAYGDWPPS